jgi:hypothetical protein
LVATRKALPVIGSVEQLIEEIAGGWFYRPQGFHYPERVRVNTRIAAAMILARLAGDRGHVRVQTAAEHVAEFELLLHAAARLDADRRFPIVASQAAYDKLRAGDLYFFPMNPTETDTFILRQKA